MRDRVKQCKLLSWEECLESVSAVQENMDCKNNQAGAALQFYLRNYLYLPYGAIANLLNRKPWHVRQTLERLHISVETSGVPVSMNPAYRIPLELIDDMYRSQYGVRNLDLQMASDKEQDYLLWEAQKAAGVFDNCGEQNQHQMVQMLLTHIGVAWTDEMVAKACADFYVEYNGI